MISALYFQSLLAGQRNLRVVCIALGAAVSCYVRQKENLSPRSSGESMAPQSTVSENTSDLVLKAMVRWGTWQSNILRLYKNAGGKWLGYPDKTSQGIQNRVFLSILIYAPIYGEAINNIRIHWVITLIVYKNMVKKIKQVNEKENPRRKAHHFLSP